MSRWLIALAAVVLAVLHQDFWLWEDRTLVFGVIPSGLMYHAVYAVVAAAFWFVTMQLAWPSTVADGLEDAPAEGDDEEVAS